MFYKVASLLGDFHIFIVRIGSLKFILLLLFAIAFSRLLLVVATPESADLPDPVIYRMTGELVGHGLNPYDFKADPEERTAIAQNWIKQNGKLMPRGIDDYNYYVSSNLPASTWLYQIMHEMSQGDKLFWRSLLIIGDLGIAAGILALAASRGVPIYGQWFRIGAISLTCLYPTLILNGTIIPEEKQFQIALLFIGASAIIWKKWNSTICGILVGASLSIGVLFKFFSAFLFPLYARRLLESNWRFKVSSIFTGLSFLFFAILQFNFNFIDTMSARSVRSSMAGPQHSSVWILLPDNLDSYIFPLKIMVCTILLLLLYIKYVRDNVDMLNATASALIIFGALWLTDGAINRSNMAMVFALGVILCTDPRIGALVIASNIAFQTLCFVIIFFISWNLNLFEAISTLGFLVLYLFIMMTCKLSRANLEVSAGPQNRVVCR